MLVRCRWEMRREDSSWSVADLLLAEKNEVIGPPWKAAIFLMHTERQMMALSAFATWYGIGYGQEPASAFTIRD